MSSVVLPLLGWGQQYGLTHKTIFYLQPAEEDPHHHHQPPSLFRVLFYTRHWYRGCPSPRLDANRGCWVRSTQGCVVVQKAPSSLPRARGGPKFEANVRRLNPSATGSRDNLWGNLTYMYFCRGVAYEYFGVYGTRSRVVYVVGFWGGPKFEANVRRLNPSATSALRSVRQKRSCQTASTSISEQTAVSWTFGVSLNHEGHWGTTDDFTTSFFHFSLFSTALWDLANSRPVHSLMLSSHLFLCLPGLLPPFTVPCNMVLARPDEQETIPLQSASLYDGQEVFV